MLRAHAAGVWAVALAVVALGVAAGQANGDTIIPDSVEGDWGTPSPAPGSGPGSQPSGSLDPTGLLESPGPDPLGGDNALDFGGDSLALGAPPLPPPEVIPEPATCTLLAGGFLMMALRARKRRRERTSRHQ